MRADQWLEGEARAKVNLRLRIFPRRDDGFHPLETIFCRITLADRIRVRFRPEAGVSIRVRGSEYAPEGRRNLAARAAELFLERLGLEGGGGGGRAGGGGGGADIELEKRVPAGAGLGGGSSDAAAVLLALNRGAAEPLEPNALVMLASKLGSDVPFFVEDRPLAIGLGRGDHLLPLPLLPPRPMLLLLPALSVATGVAYALWDEVSSTSAGDVPDASTTPLVSLTDWESLRAFAINDFEEVVFGRHPRLSALKSALENTDPAIALLSGSGSALFGVYESRGQRDAAQKRLDGLEGARAVSVSGPA